MKKVLRHGTEQYIDGPMGDHLPTDPIFYDKIMNDVNIQTGFSESLFSNSESRNSASYSNSESRNSADYNLDSKN